MFIGLIIKILIWVYNVLPGVLMIADYIGGIDTFPVSYLQHIRLGYPSYKCYGTNNGPVYYSKYGFGEHGTN